MLLSDALDLVRDLKYRNARLAYYPEFIADYDFVVLVYIAGGYTAWCTPCLRAVTRKNLKTALKSTVDLLYRMRNEAVDELREARSIVAD